MTTPAARSRRSALLLLFGAVFVLLGFQYLGQAAQITATPQARLSYQAHLQLMPLDVWAWVFIGCGAGAIVAGVCRWHTLGFTLLMGISSWWGLEFAASWLSNGYGRAVIGALQWALIVGVLAICVGWRDPPSGHAAALDAFLSREDGP